MSPPFSKLRPFGAARFRLAARARRAFLAFAVAIAVALAGPARAEVYLVGSGDVLAINAYGEPDLSGEFPVGPDGSIGHPLLGNVSVIGKSTSDIRTELSARLADYLPNPSLSVTVAAYAPVYVLGDVERPGDYAFRPGMTALQLIALAGGPRRAFGEGADGIVLRIITAERDYAELALRTYSQEAQAARLTAELAGADMDFDAAAPLAVRADDAQRIAERERQIFEFRRDALMAEDVGMAAQIEGYDTEIASLTASIDLYDEELSLLVEDVEATRTLVDRGVATPTRMRELLRQLSATRRDALELRAFLARAEQGKLDAERRRQAAKDAFRTEAGTLLRQTELEVAAARTQVDALLDSLAALGVERRRILGGVEEEAVQLAIARSTEAGYRESVATERSTIQPGDILRVTLGGAQRQLVD